MQDERRAVLERVARGDLTPADAAALLAEIDSKKAPVEPEADPRDWTSEWEADEAVRQAPPPPAAAEGAATRIRVVRNVGTADIVGDPTVREAVAEGPHVARREGDTLVIEGREDDWWGPGFTFGSEGDLRGRHRQWREHRHHRRHRMGDSPLRVRINPDLPLEVQAAAGSMRLRGVHGPIRANVQAGRTDIDDFRGPIELAVQAGSVIARGRLDHGASRVHCDAGSVRIHLERGSSVRVTAHSTLGRVSFDSADSRSPWVVGGGEGTLDIDTTMGSVRVVAD